MLLLILNSKYVWHLTQREDLRNLYILLPKLGEDPNEKV